MKTGALRFAVTLLLVLFFLQPLGIVSATQPAQDTQPGTPAEAPVIAPESTLSAIYNTNLVPDGDAEAIPYTTYWKDNEGFTLILPYGASCGGNCDFPTPYDPGPVVRGNNFFFEGHPNSTYAGNGTNMWIKNRISLAPIQAAVNSGGVRFILSGYFGGDGTNPTTAQLHMFFETSGGAFKGEAIAGNVTPADRQNKTGLLYREKTGFIPSGTQDINLDLQTASTPDTGVQRTGYADNLSLVILPIQVFLPVTLTSQTKQPPAKTGFPAPSGVFVTSNGLTRMDIYWIDNSSNELGFEVQRINPNSSVDTICNTKPNVTHCFDPGLSQNTASGYIYLGSHVTYTYQVRAIGAGINSAWASGTGTTATEPLTTPSLRSGQSFTCQAIDVTSSSATFVWNDPFNYEAGFNLYVGSNTMASWSMMEGGTKITFTSQPPGSITLTIKPFVYDRSSPQYVYESNTSCTATANLPAPPSSGITYFYNDASYPVISLVVDGWEQFPVRPLAILPGAYYELDGVPSGHHTWTAVTGFWDDWGQRFSMYDYSGNYTQTGSSINVHIPDMAIQDLLSVPPANLGYWEGYYFDAYGNCYTTAFKFKQDGTYTFYNANHAVDTGTYILKEREPSIFSTQFHVTSSKQNVDGLLIETDGIFYMKNGPPSWLQITYVFKPQGYVYNSFCP